MKLSEFDAVDEEFGAGYGSVLVNDGTRRDGQPHAREALAAGMPPRDVWLALCAATDVPPERWHGVGRRKPGHRAAIEDGDTRARISRTFVRLLCRLVHNVSGTTCPSLPAHVAPDVGARA